MKHPIEPSARTQLWCFPYAGGGPSLFRSWQAELGPAVRVVPVQLPGRERRIHEAPLTSVPALAAAVAAEIADAVAGAGHPPLALFGHSFGSLLAFETARLLRRHRLQPQHLFVCALPAPQLPRRHRRIHDLPPHEFVEEIRRLKGTPEPVLQNPELLALVLPKLRADFRAYETFEYQADEPLGCPISVMGGAADPSATPAELQAWREQTSRDFRLRLLPGDHFFIHGATHLLTWAIVQDLRAPVRAAS